MKTEYCFDYCKIWCFTYASYTMACAVFFITVKLTKWTTQTVNTSELHFHTRGKFLFLYKLTFKMYKNS